MVQITFPQLPFRLKKEAGKEYIFDEIRKGWFIITPEEWVRQNVIQYLTAIKKYPKNLIAVEKELKVGELRKRFDILVYKNSLPWMIIECKQQDVELSHQTIQQLLAYNTAVKATYLCITNAAFTFLWKYIDGKVEEVSEFESW